MSGIIDWNTVHDASTKANRIMDCTRRTGLYMRAMKPLNPQLMIPTGNRSSAKYGIPAHCSCLPRTPTMALISRRVREAGKSAIRIIEPKLTLMTLIANALDR